MTAVSRQDAQKARAEAASKRWKREQDEIKRLKFNATIIALTYHPLVAITYAAGLLYAVLNNT